LFYFPLKVTKELTAGQKSEACHNLAKGPKKVFAIFNEKSILISSSCQCLGGLRYVSRS
jgi:hypothetical protein